ncbi:ATP-binding protein [Balneolaceae bacterium ANBcel3]|nr:ATP-binding protein [Balneolaceae bacterium ANBcel3]
MHGLDYKKVVENGSFGFTYLKTVCISNSNNPDFVFLSVNSVLEQIFGISSKDLIHKRLSEVHPDLDKGAFHWTAFFSEVVQNEKFSECEAYYPPLKRWLHVQATAMDSTHLALLINDISREKLIADSSQYYLEAPDTDTAHQRLCDIMHTISGARFTGFNIFENNGRDFKTVALSGVYDIMHKIHEVFGHPIIGKKWKHDAKRLKKMQSKRVVTFDSLFELAGHALPEKTISTIEQLFNIGKIYIARIDKDGKILGDFTLIMPSGQSLVNETLIEIYVRQIALILEKQNVEKELDQFFNVSLDILCITDLEGRFLRVSRQMETLLGYPANELQKNSFVNYIHPEDLPKTKKALRRLAQQKPVTGLINRFIARDGSVKYLEWHCQPREHLVYSAARDVSGRIEQEEAQKHQSDLLELLVTLATSYIHVPVNEMETVINRSLADIARYCGVDRSYIFEFDHDKYVCSNTHEWCATGIVSYIDDFQNIPLEIMEHTLGCDASAKPKEVINTTHLPEDDPLREILESRDAKSFLAIPMVQDSRCIGIVGFDSVNNTRTYCDREKLLLKLFAEMLISMSKRARLEQQLILEKVNAQTANRTKNSFLANMSHELRTPLIGVIGFTDLLKSTSLTDHQKSFIENVDVSAKALLTLVNDLLDLSRLETGKLELITTKTDVFRLLDQVCGMFTFEASNKNLSFEKNVQKDMPGYALLDAVRLKKVLAKLIGNAIKFTEKGGVSIDVGFSKLDNQYGCYRFSVKDTGIGISEEQKEKLFQAFSHGDEQITQKYGGMGLGLAISNLLVKKMGGAIHIESTPGKGSSFSFVIETAYYDTP